MSIRNAAAFHVLVACIMFAAGNVLNAESRVGSAQEGTSESSSVAQVTSMTTLASLGAPPRKFFGGVSTDSVPYVIITKI